MPKTLVNEDSIHRVMDSRRFKDCSCAEDMMGRDTVTVEDTAVTVTALVM